MRIRSLVLAAALAGAGCATNPDPRGYSYEVIQRTAYGGWIELTLTSGAQDRGELLVVGGDDVTVLDDMNFVETFPRAQIATARLWKYHRPDGNGVWGLIGSLTTISHGFFLIFTLPVWIATTSIGAGVDSAAQHLDVPGDDWDELAKWSRFPQGVPPGTDVRAMLGRVGPPGGR